MTIYLDDQPLQLKGRDLKSLLVAASDHLSDAGRIVVEVQVDGQPLVEEALDQQYTEELGDAEVRLYSADPSELAVMTLEQVKEKLNDARQAQAQAADFFQEDKLDLALKQVVGVIEVWQQTQQAVLQSVQLLGMSLDNMEVEGRSVPDMTDALLNQVSGLRDLLSAGDTVGLADAMAFEWPQTANDWEELMTELRGWIQRRRDGDST